MNKIYKVIWSKARNCWVVASEIAKNHSKGGTGVSGVVKKAGSSALLTAAVTAMLLTPLGTASADEIPTQDYDPASENLVIGHDVEATSTSNVVVGVHSSATQKGGVAVGVEADATNENSIAIGNDVDASGKGGVAIGHEAAAQSTDTIAIGSGATATDVDSIAIGQGAESSAKDSTAVGPGATAEHKDDSAFGSNATASGQSATALGHQAEASGKDSIAGGYGATASGGSTVAFGEDSKAAGASDVAVGAGSYSNGGSATAVGAGSEATANNASAYGSSAEATALDASAFGTDSVASGRDSTAIGASAIASDQRSVALGGGGDDLNAAQATGPDAIAVGGGSIASADSSVAIGGGGQDQGAVADGKDAVALGTGTKASGEQSVAIGGGDENEGATALGDASIVMGNQATSAEGATNGVAIGTGSSVTVENGVALGAGSIANVGAAEEPGFIPNPKSYITYDDNPTWQSNEAAVSIGNPDGTMTRQITGVAAGTNDWDAANVAQLKAAMTHYYSVNTTKETDEEGNNNYANDGATGNNALAAGVHTTATGDYSTAMGPYAAANGNASIAIGSAKVDASGKLTTKQVAIVDEEGNPVLDEEGNPTYKTVTVTDTNPQATGMNGIAIGTNAKAWNDNAIAMGTDTQVWGNNGTAVGTETQASTNASAYGYQAKAHGEDSTAIGYTTYVSGKDSTAVGSHATSQGPNSTSVGLYATTNGADQTAVGEGAVVDYNAQYGTAVGYHANAKNTYATAVSGVASGYESTAVGKYADAEGSQSTAVMGVVKNGTQYGTSVGMGSTVHSGQYGAAVGGGQVNGNYGTAVGSGSSARSENSTGVGKGANGVGTNSTAVGYGSSGNSTSTTAVGHGATANGTSTTTVGNQATTGNDYATSVGYSSTAKAAYSTTVGSAVVDSSSTYGTAVGTNSTVNYGQYGTAVGGGVSAAQYATAVGRTTNAGGQYATAIGNNNTAGGSYATAVGYKANGLSSESTAVGYQAQGNGYQGTAVGWSSNAGNSQSTAVGYYAQGTGSQSTAVGYSADANNSQSTAVGYNAQGNGTQSTSVGYSSHAGSSNSTAVGYSAQGNGANSTAAGYGAVADGTNATSIGNTANAHGQQSTAIGGGVTGFSSQYGIAIGQSAGAGSTNSTAIGSGAQSPATNATAVGYNADAKNEAATAVGKQAQAQNSNSTAVGNVANAGGSESTAVGNYAQATYSNATAVGNSAKGNNYNATGVGYNANAGGSNSAAVGYLASAWGTNGAAVGYNSGAGENAAALGYGANAYGTNAAALGYGASAGSNAVAAGVSANAWGANGIALGTSANAGNDAVVLGRNAVGWKDDTIVLGKDSKSGEDKQQGTDVHGYDPLEGVGDPVDYTSPTWQSTNNAVSFGRAEEKVYDEETGELIETIPQITRQINNVAAGTLDTDVVNVAQLKRAIGQAVDGSGIHYYGSDESKDPVKDDAGNITTPGTNVVRIHNQQLNIIGDSEYGEVTTTKYMYDGVEYFEQEDGTWLDADGNAIAEGATPTAETSTGIGLIKKGNILTSIKTHETTGIPSIKIELNEDAMPHYYSVNADPKVQDNYNNDGATGLNALAAGTNAKAFGDYSVAIGDGATAGSVEGEGEEAVRKGEGTVALGYGSVANREKGDTGVNPLNAELEEGALETPTWTSTDGAVSVGVGAYQPKRNAAGKYVDADDNEVETEEEAAKVYVSTKTRQITNVAAGKEDTDAVNVAQLKVASTHYYSVNTETGDAPEGVDSNFDNQGATGKGAMAAGFYTSAAGQNSVATGYNSNSGSKNSVAIGYTADAYGEGAIALGHETTSGALVTISQSGTGTDVMYESHITRVKIEEGDNAGNYIFRKLKEAGTDGYDVVAYNTTDQTYHAVEADSAVTGGYKILDKIENFNTDNLNMGGVSMGSYAHAEGQRSLAVGRASGAYGEDSSAIGIYANAVGDGAMAIGHGSSSGVVASVHESGAEGTAERADGFWTTEVATDGTGNPVANGAIGGIAIGSYAHTEGTRALAVGRVASAYGENSTAIGLRSSAYGEGSMAFGHGVVAGDATDPNAKQVVELHNNPSMSYDLDGADGAVYHDAEGNEVTIDHGNVIGAVAIGSYAEATARGALSVGRYSKAASAYSTTLGIRAEVNDKAENAIAIGREAKVEALDDSRAYAGMNSIAIGTMTDVKGQNSIAIGMADMLSEDGSEIVALADRKATTVTGDNSIAIGMSDTIEGTSSIAVGTGHVVKGNASGAFGDPNTVTGDGSYAFGNNSTIDADDAFVLGNDAKVEIDGGVAIGSKSVAGSTDGPSSGGYDVITGVTNYTDNTPTWSSTDAAVSVGGTQEDGSVVTRQIRNVAAGSADTDAVNVAQLKRVESAVSIHDYSVQSPGPDLDDNYNNKGAKDPNAMAAGVNARAIGENSTAVGNLAQTLAANATAIGNMSEARGESSVALGDNAIATGNNAAAIGDNTVASIENSVALGSGAQTVEVVGTPSYTISGTTYEFAGAEPVGTVSVGAAGEERTITNVAAGRISETSTDAINGSQLYAVIDAMDGGLQFGANKPEANSGNPVTNKLGSAINIVGEEPAAGAVYSTKNLTTTVDQDEDGNTTIQVKMNRDLDVDTVVVNGKDGKDGKIGINGEDGVTSYITVNHDGEPGVDGKDGITRIIIDDKPVATLDDGMKYGGDFNKTTDEGPVPVKLNKIVDVKGNAASEEDLVDGNIGVVAEPDGENAKLTVKLNKDIDLGDEGSITFGDVHIHDGDEISFGDNVIHNVAPGVEDNDVVNVSQLKQYSAAARTEVSVGDVRVTEDGTPVTGGNLELKRTKDENDEHEIYDVRLAKDIDVDTIVVNGKDGKDGKIGINGEDGVTSYITVTHDGEPGVDGKDGITRIIIDDKPVATLDDGLKFGANAPEANSGNPVANKLNSTVNIKAADAVEGHTYSTKNLTTTVDQDEDGNTTILVKMDNDLETDTIVVNGKDGKDGKIGINGKDGVTSYITVTHDGEPGVDGKDGITRIIIDDKPVATLDDGLKYTGDFGDGAAVKLNKTVNVVGNAKNEDDLVDGNIGVTADQDREDGKLTIKLNKDINLGDEGSITFGDVHIHDGDEISFGDNVIHNVAPGVEDNDVVNVSQLKQYSAAARTEVSVGDVRVTEDGTPVTGGNLELKRTKDENDEHDIYDVRLAKDIDVDTIVVNGKDGKDGAVGLTGKDGVTRTITITKDGAPGLDGKDGEVRIVYEDGEHNTHEVATLDDGLKFGANKPEANSGNPVANKLNSTINILGEEPAEGTVYSTKNLTTTVDQDEDGNTTILVKMNRDLDVDTIVVNGKDGKDGKIGINGEDGQTTTISVQTDGKPGLDGEDGITRIVYKDPEGNDHDVATLDDGLKYAGDFGDGAAVKLNNTVNVKGEAENEEDLTDGNIGVVANQNANGKDADLIIKLNKDIDLTPDGSVTMGDTVINNDGLTINEGPSFTKNKIDVAGNKIINVAPGEDGTDAVNVDQLKEYSAAAKTEVTVGGGVKAGTDGNYATGGNLDLAVSTDPDDGHEIYDLKLADNVELGGPGKDGKDGVNGSIGVNGADGKSGVGIDGENGITVYGKDGKDGAPAVAINGKDGVGHIGLTGPAGADGKDASADIHVQQGPVGVDGTDGADGTDGMDRIVYEDHNGTTHEVATLDDGMKYSGDFGNTKDNPVPVKLNNIVDIVGESTAASEDELSDGNIGVVAKADGDGAKLVVKLNKNIDLTEEGSVTMGDTVINNEGLTINEGPSFTKNKIDVAGNKIINVAPGEDGTDAVNVDQLKEYSAAAKTEVTVGGGVKAGTDGNYNTGGNLDLNVSTADDGHEVYDLKLADNVELGGPKDGKDGVNGSIGVNGADGKSGVGIDGKDGITVYGKDGKDGDPAVSIRGEDGVGHIGLAGPAGKDGKDGISDIHMIWGDPTVGNDGDPGKDGITRIEYTDPEGNPHQVATMDDGLYFGANSGDPNPAANKLTSTVEIKGAGEKDDENYSGENLKTIISQTGEGAEAVTTINVVMDKDLNVDNIAVNGKDGKDGTIGINGRDGTNGKDGTNRVDIQVGPSGEPGLDGKDGVTRIIYEDGDGEHEVATLDDGMKYAGDFGDGAAVKLNKTVNVIGEAKNEDDLTTGNIGVVAEQDGDDGKLTVKLNKDIDLGKEGSVTTGDTVINDNGLTINEGPSVTKEGIDAGGNKIINVAPGEADTDAVNVSQLRDFEDRIGGDITNINNNLNKLGDRVNKVGAGAAALAGLHPLDFDPDAKWDVAAGYGHYKGENAVAIGAFYRPSEDVMLNVASTVGNGDNMVSAGVSVKIGGANHVSNSRVALAKQVLEMRKEMEDMKSLMADSAFGRQLDLSKIQLFPDTPENHWAYDYVATLAGNGLLEGYPDGNFRGDRDLTRYEVAAILYRAMMNGAQLTQRALEEFAPELDRIRVDTLTRHSDGTPSIQRVRIIKDRR